MSLSGFQFEELIERFLPALDQLDPADPFALVEAVHKITQDLQDRSVMSTAESQGVHRGLMTLGNKIIKGAAK